MARIRLRGPRESCCSPVEVAETRLFSLLPKREPNSLRYLGLGGAAYRTRTCDPRITNAMLYQLS